MRIKVSNSDLQKFVGNLRESIEELTDRNQLSKLGEFLVEKIRIRTRLGSGVTNNLDNKSRLNSLSEKYVLLRKKFRGLGELSSLTTPTKSNLTLSGSMLDSLKVKNIDRNSITIGADGFDRNGISNEDKTEYQEDMGRIYLRLSIQEVKQARIFWLRNFSDLLKNKKLV
jgi:hypothetical protein